jgi:cytochrome P450
VRETLRLHAPVPSTLRVAVADDAIPLSTPFVDARGVERAEIAMKKGDTLFIPILLVNRAPELWGADASTWDPARWTDGRALPAIPGVWGSTLSFLGGPHACIGFRFSLYESAPFFAGVGEGADWRRTKIILHALLCAFAFELPVEKAQIEGRGGMVTRPRVRGAKEGGLPLRVRRAPEEA